MNAKLSLHARALGYLARREHSRQELEKKLSAYAPVPAELTALLDELERQRLLSDERFVEQMVYARRLKYGSKRIQHELRMKGIAEHLITAALQDFKQTEVSSAHALLRKKFGASPADLKERSRQIRFLAGKGFSSEAISRALAHDREMEN
ncbi:recombination regulator RecX [Nitrosomonas sp. ANs5]|uniref:recombination regulator RecX n=1 Tax=Nitrosomonas sp. ANs5 TaxID=3423941 RepID=UPI003D3305C5